MCRLPQQAEQQHKPVPTIPSLEPCSLQMGAQPAPQWCFLPQRLPPNLTDGRQCSHTGFVFFFQKCGLWLEISPVRFPVTCTGKEAAYSPEHPAQRRSKEEGRAGWPVTSETSRIPPTANSTTSSGVSLSWRLFEVEVPLQPVVGDRNTVALKPGPWLTSLLVESCSYSASFGFLPCHTQSRHHHPNPCHLQACFPLQNHVVTQHLENGNLRHTLPGWAFLFPRGLCWEMPQDRHSGRSPGQPAMHGLIPQA